MGVVGLGVSVTRFVFTAPLDGVGVWHPWFVKVEAVEERLLTLGHLLPVDTVQADTFIWLEINASSLLLGIF